LVTGATYNWTNSNTATGLAASGNGDIASFIATNNTANQITSTITVTPTASGCSGTPKTFVIKVNPTASVIQPLDQSLCNGSNTFLISFSGLVASATYNWTNSNTATGLTASGNGNIASFVATNNTAAQITSTITVNPTASGCAGSPKTFIIKVDPTASVVQPLDQTLCANTNTNAITFSGAVAGTIYTWSNSNTGLGLAASGNGNITSFVAINNTAVQITSTITVTPSASGCAGTPKTFVIKVNPTASVIQPLDQTLCASTNTAAITFAGVVSAATYNWTNSNTALGLAATGTGNIASFVATNNTASQITSTITVTPTASGCLGSPKTFVIKVDPTPSVVQPLDQTLCNGSNTSLISFTGLVAGATYNWTNTNTTLGLSASGTGNIVSFVATNNTASQQTSTITVTPTASGCAGTPKIFVIKVDPTPSVTQPVDQTLCANTNTSIINFTGLVSAALYNWTNSNIATGLSASGTGNIASFIATNNTASQITSTITVTPTAVAGGCVGAPKTFVIKVNPTPSVTQPVDQTLCNGSNTLLISFSGLVAGATYNWTNSNTTTGLSASGIGDIASFIATNNTASQITSTISVTPTANACVGAPKTFIIKVNPTASVVQPLNQILCANTNTSVITFAGAVTGSTYDWTNSNTATGLAASGSGNIASFIATNNTASQITSTITVTPTTTAGSCVGAPKTFVIKVNPTPSVVQPLDQTLCANTNTAIINFAGTVTGATYTWANSNTSTGLAVNGVGDIPSFIATNNTAAQITSTITVTPNANACTGTPKILVIKVDPTPSVVQPLDQTLCNGSNTSLISFSGLVANTTYNWANSNTATGLIANGSGNINSFIATNNTGSQITSTITITPTAIASGCVGTPKTFVIKVDPTPSVIQPIDQTLCANSNTTAITFNGLVTGATYNWTNSNTALGLAASGSGNIASFVATNNTTAQITTTITVTPTANGCLGTPKIFIIKVDPTPSVVQPLDETLCANTNTTAINFAGAIAGSTYTWSNSNTAVGLGTSGIGNIPSFVATNNTTSQITSTIIVTPTSANTGGCAGSPKTFVIKVDPTPSVSQPLDQTLCANTNTTAINFAGAVAGSTYTWSNSNTATGLNASGVGDIPSFAATNNTASQIISTITVTPTANGCLGTPKTFIIKVDPTPSVVQPLGQTLCANTNTTAINFAGAVAGSTYTWSNSNSAVGLAANGTGNITSFVATNNTASQITSTITVTPSAIAGGCVGSPKTFVIKVDPTPSVVQPLDQTLCANTNTTAINFASAIPGSIYTWINSNTATGLNASGVGDIASFVAINNTASQITSTINVTPTASGCLGLPKTFVIKVDPTPSVTQPLDQTLCANTNTSLITITGNVAGASYNWTNSNTATGLSANGIGNIASFVATNNTSSQITSTIIITPTANACAGTPKTFVIKVNPTPSVIQPLDETLCANTNTTAITFAGAVSGTNYNWTNSNTALGLAASGTGNIASFVATNYTISQITSTITVTPTASGCAGIPKTFIINVNPTPSASQPFDQTLCANTNTSLITITGSVAGASYNWTNSNTETGLSASGNGNIAPFIATNNTASQITSTITVTPTANSCAGTPKIFLIKVNPMPNVTLPVDQTVCANTNTSAINFVGAVSGSTYTWSNSNTTSGLAAIGTGNIPSFVATNNTSSQITSTITVTPNANTCIGAPKIFVIKVNPTPNVLQPLDQTLCANTNTNAITINGGVTGASYNWTNSNTAIGLAASGTGNIASFTALNNTNTQIESTITITPNIGSCAGAPKTFTIKVNSSLSIIPGNDVAICKGANVNLSAQGAQNFEWTPSLGLNCSQCANPIASPDSTTTYTVKALPNTGCQNTGTITITVHQPIKIITSPKKQICNKESFNLWANGASTYLWSPSQSLSSATSPNPTATPNATTQYMVIGFDNHNCFKDTGYVILTVFPKPTIQLGADQTLSTGTLFPITSVFSNGPIVKWLWSPTTDLSCTNCPKPIATVRKDITYTATITNIYGCTASDDIRIHTMCEASQVYVPNAFTPDGDGRNDILMVRSKGIEAVRSFKIYSRWGELIFEKTSFPPNNPTYGWDGKIKGMMGAAEVYVYIAEVTCDNNESYFIKGNVTLLK
jgi:gliding motility-associated-like protein